MVRLRSNIILPTRPGRAAVSVETTMNKRMRGNKEVKKPKHAPREVPQPVAEIAAPAPTSWPRPRQARK
jgi:hypothetical protein